MKKLLKLSKVKIAFLSLFLIFVLLPNTVDAELNGNSYQPGRIIDDAIFFDNSTMTPSQIQKFLEDKVPNCDTEGNKEAWNTGILRKNYSSENPPEFTCLRDYWQNPITGEDNYGDGVIPNGAKRASRLIYDVAQEYKINPQVLLVLLQKEQALITDDWPWQIQYRSATGYGCPDKGATCDEDYYGFYNQLANAAWQFNDYKNRSYRYAHAKGITSDVYYQVPVQDSNGNWVYPCGSDPVYMQNHATAGLYNYTPYQPNQAALNNLYETGDDCSAYGNRNFWRDFNDWFGSTYSEKVAVSNLQIKTYGSDNRYADKLLYATFTVKNISNHYQYIGGIKVVAEDSSGKKYSFATDRYLEKIAPNETITYKRHLTLPNEGRYTFSVQRYAGEWRDPPFEDLGVDKAMSVARYVHSKPTILTNLELDKSRIHEGEFFNTSFTLKNNSSRTLDLGRVKVIVKERRSKKSYNFSFSPNLSLAAGETYDYSATRALPREGYYDLYPTTYKNGIWNDKILDKESENLSTVKKKYIKKPVSVIDGLSLLPNVVYVNDGLEASFTIKNHSDKYTVEVGRIKVIVRDTNNEGFNYSFSKRLTLAPGETYTYQDTRSFPHRGYYNMFITTYTKEDGWQKNALAPETSDNTLEKNKYIKPIE